MEETKNGTTKHGTDRKTAKVMGSGCTEYDERAGDVHSGVLEIWNDVVESISNKEYTVSEWKRKLSMLNIALNNCLHELNN